LEVAGFAGGTGGFEIREIFENSMLALFLFPTKKAKLLFYSRNIEFALLD